MNKKFKYSTSDIGYRRSQAFKFLSGSFICLVALALILSTSIQFNVEALRDETQALRPKDTDNSVYDELGARSVLGGQGIVVPKRSALIYGLDEQFRQRNGYSNKTQHSQVHLTGLSQHLPSLWPGSRPILNINNNNNNNINHNNQLKPKRHQLANSMNTDQPSTLYLERYQQEILAANPNLSIMNPILSQQISRANSLNVPLGSMLMINGSSNQNHYENSNSNNDNSNSQHSGIKTTNQPSSVASNTEDQDPQQQQQQLYKGYSLIELEIKNEQDRRYVQDLYANLSAVVNEQAANLKAAPQVSPYVDVDFWSFGRLSSLNDHIDVMVSPRSKPLLLGKLARARIKYQVKIDDIQAKIDRDMLQYSNGKHNSQVQLAEELAMFEPSNLRNHNHLASGQSHHQSNALNGRAHSLQPMNTNKQNSNSIDNNKFQHRESTLHARQAIDTSSGSSSTSTSTSSSSSSSSSSSTPNNINAKQKPLNDSAFFENYQRLSTVNQYLESIVQRNSDVAQVKVIGRSSQGRHLRVLKLGYGLMNENYENCCSTSSKENISDQPEDGRANTGPTQSLNATQILNNFFRRQESTQKVGSIWLDGGTHAREWISPSTVLYLAFRLSDNHFRCNNFFVNLKSLVAQHEQSVAIQTNSNNVDSKSQTGSNSKQQANLIELSPNLDMNILIGINEINTQLLSPKLSSSSSSSGNQAKFNSYRPRTELEQMLELLAKSPQVLASEYGCDLEVDQLLRRYTFFIMPILNPDGYEYSHTHNRLWRKTRSTSKHPIYRHFCLGVDPNRNYDAQHGSTGSSSHPCSQTYAGATPFTEPETRHQSNFVYANRFGMKMYISFHSYSQMILLPLSHSRQPIPDLKDLESVGMAAVKAIEQTHGTVYKVGQSASILYTASGTASDWAYEKANIKYSYTIELRDTGAHGFLLPRQQIIPTGEETFNGLLAMISQMEKNGNLLTSKSTPTASGLSNGIESAIFDYNRASQDDLDRLDSHNQRRNRPFLESVRIQNSESSNETGASGSMQAMAQSSLLGVRDRKATTPALLEDLDSNEIQDGDGYEPHARGPMDPSEAREGPLDPLGQPVEPLSELEVDANFAIEGEGELMEPARDISDSRTRAHVAESKLSSRRIDSSRRIGLRTKIALNGRNSINSPIERDDGAAFKRESSGSVSKFKRSVLIS